MPPPMLMPNICERMSFRSTPACTGPFAGVEGVHAVEVVQLALLIIPKDLVGLGDGLELDLGLGSHLLGDLVGVMLEGKLRNLVS